MLNTSSLLPEFRYKLQRQVSKVNKICQFKVTEAYQRAIQFYMESSYEHKKLTIRNTNNKLCFVIKYDTNKDVVFNLSPSNLSYSLSTFKLSGKKLSDLGSVQQKIQVQGNSDAFKSTKKKVETAEAEAKRVRTKELDLHQRKNIKCSRTVRSNQHLISTTTNSVSSIRKSLKSSSLSSTKLQPSTSLLANRKRPFCHEKYSSNKPDLNFFENEVKKIKYSSESPSSSVASLRKPNFSEFCKNDSLMEKHIAQILIVMPRKRKALMEKLRNISRSAWSFTDKQQRDLLNKCLSTVCDYDPKTQNYSLKEQYFHLVKADWPEYSQQNKSNVKQMLLKHNSKAENANERRKYVTDNSNNTQLKPESLLLPRPLSQNLNPSTDFLTQNFGNFLESKNNSSVGENSKTENSNKNSLNKTKVNTNQSEFSKRSDFNKTNHSSFFQDAKKPELKEQTKTKFISKVDSQTFQTENVSNINSYQGNKTLVENKKDASTVTNVNINNDRQLVNVGNLNEKNNKLKFLKSKENLFESKEKWLEHLQMDQSYKQDFSEIESDDQYERYKLWFNENYQTYTGYLEEYTKVIADLDEKTKEWQKQRKKVLVWLFYDVFLKTEF